MGGRIKWGSPRARHEFQCRLAVAVLEVLPPQPSAVDAQQSAPALGSDPSHQLSRVRRHVVASEPHGGLIRRPPRDRDTLRAGFHNAAASVGVRPRWRVGNYLRDLRTGGGHRRWVRSSTSRPARLTVPSCPVPLVPSDQSGERHGGQRRNNRALSNRPRCRPSAGRALAWNPPAHRRRSRSAARGGPLRRRPVVVMRRRPIAVYRVLDEDELLGEEAGESVADVHDHARPGRDGVAPLRSKRRRHLSADHVPTVLALTAAAAIAALLLIHPADTPGHAAVRAAWAPPGRARAARSVTATRSAQRRARLRRGSNREPARQRHRRSRPAPAVRRGVHRLKMAAVVRAPRTAVDRVPAPGIAPPVAAPQAFDPSAEFGFER
jgi:hypothetical protein